MPRAHSTGRVQYEGTAPRSRRRRHVPGPLRERRHPRERRQPPRAARHRRPVAVLRADRPAPAHLRHPRHPGVRGGRRLGRPVLHRSPRGRRRDPGAGRRRLACPVAEAFTGPPAASRWGSCSVDTSPPGAGRCSASTTSCSATRSPGSTTAGSRARALISALESAGTGRLSDIVATIQGEQDEVIRARCPACSWSRGGRAPARPSSRSTACRVPPLHPPLPARGPGRAGHRAEPPVPLLHRAGAALAR